MKNILAFLFIFFLLGKIFNEGLIFAQEQKDTSLLNILDLSIEDLMKLEVSGASNIVKETNKMPVSVTTINNIQLQLSGARTLAEAIMIYVPGFFLTEDQDDLIAGFRGLSPDNNSKVILLINGQNLNNEWFWGAPTTILQSLNFNYVYKVEVIRGPGSVTLGQGALLGVINIITKTGEELKESGKISEQSVAISGGRDNFMGAYLDASFIEGNLNGSLHVASTMYDGQQLRNEGWVKDKINEGYEGGSIFDIGTRLKRSKNDLIVGQIGYKNLQFQFLYSDIKKDNYNFYRDRNVLGESLTSLSLSHKYKLSSNVLIKTDLNYAIDNYNLSSVKDYSMGGIREDRYGIKIIANINWLIPNNRLALGTEIRRFEFGKKNFDGNNFINNVIDTNTIKHYSNYLENANLIKTMGYKADINVYSFVLEDVYTLLKKYDLFLAFRYDKHPYWGNNLSPRLGLIANLRDDFRIRFTYQTGFRGACGVHYGGGFRLDGFLSESNFDKVEAASIPIFQDTVATLQTEKNIPKVKPEKIQNFEIALDYDITKFFNFNIVGFYNIIKNVIDVGVIYTDPKYFKMVNIGSEVPGDWNGYWFYKNTVGNIVEAGTETTLSFKHKDLIMNLSHSFVKILSASEQQRGSMYVTKENFIRVYPENVTRLNAIISVTDKVSMGVNCIYYYSWYSPSEKKNTGNTMVNLVSTFKLSNRFTASVSVMNVLGQLNLYPMNSNSLNPELSDGTPSYEKTSFWVKLKYNF